MWWIQEFTEWLRWIQSMNFCTVGVMVDLLIKCRVMVGAGTIPNLHSSKSDHYLGRQLIKAVQKKETDLM
uniref:Uncharacterized protein n=1 Tax=Magallana gigas TaxID=29159 RepID=K1QHU5_MAGGI